MKRKMTTQERVRWQRRFDARLSALKRGEALPTDEEIHGAAEGAQVAPKPALTDVEKAVVRQLGITEQQYLAERQRDAEAEPETTVDVEVSVPNAASQDDPEAHVAKLLNLDPEAVRHA